jgi:hypothetical protein
VTIVEDEASGQTILEIEVRGKRGIGYCKSMTGAVRPFERLKSRLRPILTDNTLKEWDGRKNVKNVSSSGMRLPQPTDLIFPKWPREIFDAVLEEENLKFDRDGRPRTAYSLRHTYICLRLMEGADIYQIAKNCRTSVEMIEKYYASHIKTNLDAAAINLHAAETEKEAEPAENAASTGTFAGNRRVKSPCLHYDRKRNSHPCGRGGMADAEDLGKT